MSDWKLLLRDSVKETSQNNKEGLHYKRTRKRALEVTKVVAKQLQSEEKQREHSVSSSTRPWLCQSMPLEGKQKPPPTGSRKVPWLPNRVALQFSLVRQWPLWYNQPAAERSVLLVHRSQRVLARCCLEKEQLFRIELLGGWRIERKESRSQEITCQTPVWKIVTWSSHKEGRTRY